MKCLIVATFFLAVTSFTWAEPEKSKFFGFNSVEEFVLNRETKLKTYISNIALNAESKSIEKMYNNHILMFELALYYAGFPKEIFYKVEFGANPCDSHYDGFSDYYLFYRRGKVRNFAKFVYFAKKYSQYSSILRETKSSNYIDMITPIEIDSNAKTLSVSINDFVKLCEKERMQLYSKYKRNPNFVSRAYELHDAGLSEKYQPRKNASMLIKEIHAYYRGVDGIKKDLNKVKYYVFLSHQDVWKFFYSGYLAPKDTELALHILKLQNTEQSRAEIRKIKSGYYDNLKNCPTPRFDKTRSIEFSKL